MRRIRTPCPSPPGKAGSCEEPKMPARTGYDCAYVTPLPGFSFALRSQYRRNPSIRGHLWSPQLAGGIRISDRTFETEGLPDLLRRV